MKKLFFIIIFISTIIVTGLAIMLLFSNEITDRFNPLVPKEEIYVQVNKDGHAKSPGGYDYTLIGYNAKGKQKQVTFYASGELQKDAYLRVYAKGKYIETWEEVSHNDIPKKAKAHFS
ncbi:MAG: YxeA family protein [Bacillota bacterium]|uniref:YxeA family protein n=1 Tax=Virgibacillus TaxID=84406 RepID=UPI00042752AC|nr:MULTISPECIES: YxeA family protein [Bacillaceae]MCC2252487.1 YxeA family protein [Virgibacillus sp. AGTR]MDY7046087.1 YxeA family protein [Virgibacillus sp. M23]QRZ18741.1 YxeA family protein [Virgibacillus sp. AGTR]WBX81682.1 YxeA family protein [Virgibacillus salarius]